METTHDFLAQLELGEDAQERDIRRAYAKKLKLIDQEADPAAFQALREAYDVALDWARWKLAQESEAPQPAPVAPPLAVVEDAVPLEAPLLDAAQLGNAVFERLGLAVRELDAIGMLGDVDAWRAAIEARLKDEELVSIDARTWFEACAASMLASGWRPGHEAFFPAAVLAFSWGEDRRRLWQLGHAGRMLDQAIEERQLFNAQPVEERKRMRDLAQMLRQQELPSTRRIRAALPDTERMVARFPTLMEVVTSMANLERWRSVYRESGGAPIDMNPVESSAPPTPKRTFSTYQGIVILIALFALLRFLFNLTEGDTALGPGFRPPASRQASTVTVPQPVLDQVVPIIYYSPPPGASLRKLEVIYKVFLDAEHKVERVQNWLTSGEPEFDRVVGQALRAAKPFPPHTPREFEVRYTGRMVRLGPAAEEQAPAPAHMRPVPTDLLRKHIPPIRFNPAVSAREGKYTGNYRVLLDPAGKVKDFSIRKPSGDLLLDIAVENAVRAAKPFPAGTPDFEFTYSTTIFRKPAPPDQNPG